MTSAWFGLNTGLRALTAAQIALDTAAHNTANANTDGYSRQRVHLVAGDPYSIPAVNRSGLPGQIGTGVSVATIERVRDAFLDLQIRDQVAVGGDWDTRRDELAKVEALFPEPSASGLGSLLGRFWDAWEDLAGDPTSTAARAALVEQAGTLASRINRDARQLATLVSDVNAQVAVQVDVVNDLAVRIAALNEQIQRVTVSGDHPNDLADARDVLLDQLNAIVPTSVVPEADGTITVLVGGTDLVQGIRARPMTTTVGAGGALTPTWSSGGPVTLGPGRLAALVALRDDGLAAYRDQLDALARGVADAVNAIHTTGFDAGGAAGLAFFTTTAGREAETIALNATIAADPSRVAAASATSEPGNGAIAGRLADLRSEKLFAGGTQTASDFHASLVGRIGSDARQANEIAANQALLVDHLRARRESVSGVSLDEEATDMIRFQRAYQAASRVITTIDEMLDTLINRTGITGR